MGGDNGSCTLGPFGLQKAWMGQNTSISSL